MFDIGILFSIVILVNNSAPIVI